ncbi:MAG: response regulator [Bacteroidia bacterium]|nr:response regulator [Bacteroidia bacterium]
MNDCKNILVLDDEKEICLLLSNILKSLHFSAECAYTIAEAEKIIENYPRTFDAAFVDLNLPDGVGFNLISKLKQKDERTKIIIISAYDGEAERGKAEEEGVDYFISKPFNKKLITQALEYLKL